MAGIKIEGTTGNVAEVNASGDMQIVLPTAVARVGSVRNFSENDAGTITGTAFLESPETNRDFQLRISQDTQMDNEDFSYTAQNTGKHAYFNTTMTNAWSATGMQTNSGGITTTTTGTMATTWAMFPVGEPVVTYCQQYVSFNAAPQTNSTIEFGLATRSTSNPYTAADGVFFRVSSAGWVAVANQNGTEATSNFTFSYTNGTAYKFTIVIYQLYSEFWINDVLYATVGTAAANGQPCLAAAHPWSIRHAIAGGAAGGDWRATVRNYAITIGGLQLADTLSTIGNRMWGSYQGLSGGTMGSLANYANSANPTAAVPTNTTAALGTGLGGQFWETDTLAATTDGIISSYQVPAGTVNVPGRRLKINGVIIDSFVSTVLGAGGYVAQWSLAFGHTAVSLATAEAATTKQPRRIALGVQDVASAAAANTRLTRIAVPFVNAIYVNPGEFVATVKKKVGTASASGVISHVIFFDYGWE